MPDIELPRQQVLYLNDEGKVVSRTQLSPDRREVLNLPKGAVRVITTPPNWAADALGSARESSVIKVSTKGKVRDRKKFGQTQNFTKRSSVPTYSYRSQRANDFNYFGATHRIRLYQDGCGTFRVGEELEQSYFKPHSSQKQSSYAFSGPYHDVTESAVAPNMSSLYFTGTGDNVSGGTGGVLFIDHHTSLGFSSGFTTATNSAAAEAANFAYMHVDFWFKPGSHIKAGVPIFGKLGHHGSGLGSTGAGEFALCAHASGLQWKWTQTDSSDITSFSNSCSITGTEALRVIGLTGENPGQTSLLDGGTSAWHHIQVERAQSQFRFYIDGSLIKVQSIGTGEGIIGACGDFVVGGFRNGLDAINGYVDQFHYRVGAQGATATYGVLGRGYLGSQGFTTGSEYHTNVLTAGATVAVPIIGIEGGATGSYGSVFDSTLDQHSTLFMPMDGLHRCARVIDRGNHKVTGRVIGWDKQSSDLYIDNVGWTGSLVSGTGDMGEDYFSRDYGWVFAERGDQRSVAGSPAFPSPSVSSITYTQIRPSPTGSPTPALHPDIHIEPSIHAPATAAGALSPSATAVPRPTTHEGVTAGSWNPSPNTTLSVAAHNPMLFTPTPHALPSISPSPSPTPSTSVTVGAPTPTSLSPTPSRSPSPSPHPHGPAGTFDGTSPSAANSPSFGVAEPTTSPGVLAGTVHVGPEPSDFILTPSPCPCPVFHGLTSSPHLQFHASPTAPKETRDFGDNRGDDDFHGPPPTLGLHGQVHPGPSSSPVEHLEHPKGTTGGVRGNDNVPTPHQPELSPKVHSTERPDGGLGDGEGIGSHDLPTWYHPEVHPIPSDHNSDQLTPHSHSLLSPKVHTTIGVHEIPHKMDEHWVHPSPSPVNDDTDFGGSLSTYEVERVYRILGMNEAKSIAREVALNEAAINTNAVIMGASGSNGELKHLFEDSTGSSGGLADSISDPDGAGVRLPGGITNPETGIAETYHHFTCRPTLQLLTRLNSIVLAGLSGKKESFYSIPDAEGAEHLFTWHDCRLLQIDITNYRFKIENSLTTVIGAIDKAVTIAEVRTEETKAIPMAKSGAASTGRITSFKKMVTDATSTVYKTNYNVTPQTYTATASFKTGSNNQLYFGA